MTTQAPSRPRRPAAPIDARIRERRAAVTRSAGRRRLRLLLAALAVLSLPAAAAGATRTALLDVDHIRVSGAEETGALAVRRAADLRRGRPMLDLRPEAGAARIERLPWVGSAEVQRRWPGTVVVLVRERVPASAVARPDGGWALVDLEGRVLAVVAQPPVGLAHVHGLARAVPPGEVVPATARDAVRAGAGLPLPLRRLVGGVNLTPTGLELGLSAGRGVVRLGDGTDLREKLRAAATVLLKVPSRQVSVLDVRVPRAPVLTRR